MTRHYRRSLLTLATLTLIVTTSLPTPAAVTKTGVTHTDSNFYAGYYPNSVGTLTIDASDSNNAFSDSNGYLGYAGNSTGSAFITGTNSKWTNTYGLYVGYNGAGTLNVSDGGLVTAQTLYANLTNLHGNGTISANGAILDGDIIFDKTHGTTQTMAFGSGGSLNLNITSTSILGVGYRQNGTLRIAEGQIVSSYQGYLGNNRFTTGTATITGKESTWDISDNLYIGYSDTGILTIQDGGQVSTNYGYLGCFQYWIPGTATVTGSDSTWTNKSDLYIGVFGHGTLTISKGGLVSNEGSAYLSCENNYGALGAATIIGPGSQWTNNGSLYLGDPDPINPLPGANPGRGKLTIADHAQVTASSLSIINGKSTLHLHISGDSMLVLGNATTTGALTNKGTIAFYADPFLSQDTYVPIVDSQYELLSITNTGTISTYGGTIDTTLLAFTTTPLTSRTAGASTPITDNARLLITDPATNHHLGLSFADVAPGITLTANPLTNNDIATLLPFLTDPHATVLAGWKFSTIPTTTALLSFDLGLDQDHLQIWQFNSTASTWTPFTPDYQCYDSRGILSFTTSSFTSYAITSIIPEPATLSLLALGGLAILRRRRST